ncbi:AaceriAFR207Cp [[Ashbya] aceris (nom. inval.)]|nr:AaceriAFR207Cp [[Ashbya] aceris (nom. inval.)]
MLASQFKFFIRPSTTGAARRALSTIKTSTKESQELLVAQRKNRPVSPHLTIYQPQLTWYLSSVHRISGVLLGGAFYAATISFGVSALLGLDLNAENLATWYHSHMPTWGDLAVKGGAAYLFAFHFGNGIRHLIWDMGRELSLKGVYRTGYAVLGLMAVGGTYLLTL